MTEPKNNMPMIVGVVVLLALAGAAAFYFSSNMTKEAPAPMAAAPTAASDADTQTAATDSANETAPASGTQSGEPAATPEEEDEATQSAKAGFNGIDVKPGNPVVAKVDGNDITRVDVFRFIKMMPANIQQLPPQAVYPLALEQVINTRLVQNKAEDANLASDPEVQQQLSMAEQQIIRSIYIQRELDKQISESDIKAKYDEAVGKTPATEEIKAAHILVDSEAKAKDIIAKLEDGGDFGKLASENSADPGNKDKGGDLGWFAKGDMVPEFSDAAFKLGKGEVSKTPVKTQFGWHVIKVEEKREREKPSLEAVKPQIMAELRREKLESMLNSWREAAKIEKFDINGAPEKQADVAPSAGEQTPAATPAPSSAEPSVETMPAPDANAPAAAE